MSLAIPLGVSVEARRHKSPSGNDWKELYKAAIFEDDRVKLVARIAEAERALADRAAELFGSNETPPREQQAMENGHSDGPGEHPLVRRFGRSAN